MANISLREYIRKIENQIDNGQIDQAIGHCKHILQIYPKHIDSYRLLGKALLEKQKYGDASDIFQRVLSSIPDDFISHIGMSIIREDENNLDAAIWHMERAFEVQPSNKAVQDELRRLYTNRDGVAPPKIRLTRGALVRMYTRGELYNQAIAEIWAALSEDPNRVDLEVILARIYFLLGQKVEATETCSKLISKLPYCYEANKILTEILPGTTREEDEKVFRQRVVDMDPYFQYVNEKILSNLDVSDTNIMVDFLDWDPSMSVNDQPDWAQSIGFALDHESAKSEDFSNWLDDTVGQPIETIEVESEDEIEPPVTRESQEVVANLDESQDEMSEIAFPTDGKGEDNEIPDWIKDAGWEVSKEEDEKLDKSFTIPPIIPLDGEISSRELEKLSEDRIDEIKDEEEEIQPAEIPGWLQEIAPAEDSINIPEQDDEFEVKNLEELFDNLEKDKSEFIRSESELSWEKEFTEDKESSLEDTLQGFDFSSLSLNEEESKTSFKSEEEFATEENFEDDLDWIKDLSIDDESVGSDNFQGTTSIENDLEIEEEEINKHSLDQIINELEEIEITDKDTTSAMDEDWLNSLVLDENKEDTEKEFFEESEKAGIPDWIKSVIDEESEQSSITSDNIVDSLPDWLSISDENIEDKFDNIKISFDEVKDRSIPVDKIIDFEELVENNEDKSIEESLSVSIEDEFLSSPEELKSEQLDNQIDPSSLEIEKIEETIAEFQPITDSQEVMDSEIQEQKTEEFILDIETLSQDVEIPEELIEEIQSNADSEEEIVSQTEELTTEEFSLDLESLSMEVEKPEELIEEIQPITDSEDEMVSQFEEQIIEEFSLDLESPSLEEEKVEELIEEDQLTIQDEENELESALAWMEGLASKQGAEEDTLLSTPEERSETPPEWVSEELKLTQDVDEELDTTPSWLKELEIETDEVLSQETTETLEEISSTEFLDLVEGKTDEITSEVVQDIDKVHDFENLFEELENEIDEEKADFPVQEVETKDEETESQELIADPSIEEEISFEKGEELSNAFLEDVVIPEEISEIDLSDAEDQKFEVIEDLSSEDQLIESVEDVQESLTLEQEPVTQIKEEIEDTHPVKVKDDRFDELEAARKFLDSGNVEESIKLFDKLIQDDFDLDSIIENIQNALDHHYPIDINLWQALGDAYVKNNQLQNALDAYSKAEDLLL